MKQQTNPASHLAPLVVTAALGVLAAGGACPGTGPATMNSCMDCHRPDGVGIEVAHPAAALTCTDCHGGDATQTDKELAHVARDSALGPVFIKRAATDLLNDVDPAYLQFMNPGDLRVASVGCGSANPASGTGSCHQEIVDANLTSVMTTFVGHYNVPRYLAGLEPNHGAIYGSLAVENPDWDEATAPQGTVASLEPLQPFEGEPRASIRAVMDNYLPKSCSYCHAYSFGLNNAPGNYRSSGCSSCHMLYANDGLSASEDPNANKQNPPHPIRHELTTAIPVEQCEHCHFQGARIGLLYQGIREGGFGEDLTPEFAEFLGEPRHDHGPDYYIRDEDTRNDVDETPPDLHYSAGMVCADCHVGRDVHGDGNIYQTAKFQVGIRCEDCHGTVRAPIEEADDGFFYTAGGDKMKQLERRTDGVVTLTTKRSFGGTSIELFVPQIKDLLDEGANPAMNEAMAPDENGWSHTDTMECYSCHTAYRQACLGCHVIMYDGIQNNDGTTDTLTQFDHQTGRSTPGLVQGKRDFYSLDAYFLGLNHRGKITTVCPSEQMFISYYDETGEQVINEQIRTTASGKLGFGWQPNHQHTATKNAQPCSRCHVVSGGGNLEEVRSVYGFGTGEYFMPDGEGTMYDLTKVLDDDGEPMVDFGHEGVSTVPTESRERALEVRIFPGVNP